MRRGDGFLPYRFPVKAAARGFRREHVGQAASLLMLSIDGADAGAYPLTVIAAADERLASSSVPSW